jgi:hypothetical protein
MRFATLALAIGLLFSVSHEAQAQVAVGGAVGVSTQSAGASDIPSLGPPLSGTSVAALGMIDFALGRHVSIGGEASLASAISGEQAQRTSSNTNAFVSRHTDSIFSGVLKLGMPVGDAVHAAFVLGGGAAYRRTARAGTTASIFPPTSRSPFSETVSDAVFAYSLGGDVDVGVTPRVRILGLVRWHRLLDDDRLPSGVVKRGVSSRILRYGVGAKFRF